MYFDGFLLGQSKIPRKGAILLKKFNDNAGRYAVGSHRCVCLRYIFGWLVLMSVLMSSEILELNPVMLPYLLIFHLMKKS